MYFIHVTHYFTLPFGEQTKSSKGSFSNLPRLASLILLLCGICSISWAQHSPIELKIAEAKNQQIEFQALDLMIPVKERGIQQKLDQKIEELQTYNLYVADDEMVGQVMSERPKAIQMNFLNPANHETIVLELVKFEVFKNGYEIVEMPAKEVVSIENPAVHYHGIIQGESGSLVCISIMENEIMGFISQENAPGNLVIGAMEEENVLICYDDAEIAAYNTNECKTEELYNELPRMGAPDMTTSVGRVSGCLGIYLDISQTIRSNKGSTAAAANYVNSLFAQVRTLYLNELIELYVEGNRVWTSTEPFAGSSSGNTLNAYRNHYLSNPKNGVLSHYVHFYGGGGIAWIDVLCSSFKYGVSGISSSFNNVPTYSWSVMVLAHELGHNFGSVHTHDCAWNGNNTSIDGCGYQAGYGGCNGPIPSNGGTVMSYCHLRSTGINLAKGFSSQPADRMRYEAVRAYCKTTNCSRNCGTGYGRVIRFVNNSSCPVDLYEYVNGRWTINGYLNTNQSKYMVSYVGRRWRANSIYNNRVMGSFTISCYTNTYTASGTNCGGYILPFREGTAEDELVKDKLELFPNPASKLLNLDLTLEHNDDQIQLAILNVQGQLVQQQSFDTHKGYNKLKLDIEQLTPGVYMIKLQSRRTSFVKKFVISR